MSDSTDVKLKAGLVPLTTLSFSGSDLNQVQQQLAQKRAEAPALFSNLPCVLDLSDLADIDLPQLKTICREAGLSAIAVKNCPAALLPQLNNLQLADLGRGQSKQNTRPASDTPAQPEEMQNTVEHPAVSEEKAQRAVKIHHANVRSGQQLYFDGDLFILGMVSAGAEVLATGDIHIYGALRGRALAGAKGDEAALISAQQFDAELVAIAGQYKLFENQHEQYKQAVVIQLSQNAGDEAPYLNINGVS